MIELQSAFAAGIKSGNKPDCEEAKTVQLQLVLLSWKYEIDMWRQIPQHQIHSWKKLPVGVNWKSDGIDRSDIRIELFGWRGCILGVFVGTCDIGGNRESQIAQWNLWFTTWLCSWGWKFCYVEQLFRWDQWSYWWFVLMYRSGCRNTKTFAISIWTPGQQRREKGFKREINLEYITLHEICSFANYWTLDLPLFLRWLSLEGW